MTSVLSREALHDEKSSCDESVTIIIPAHNEAATIADTIRSCLNQTHPIDKVIVVADNCTDGTALLAAEADAMVITGSGGRRQPRRISRCPMSKVHSS